MFKWLFSKVIKVREKVSKDLNQEDVEKPFIEHLEDLRTMLVRIAMTLAIFVLGTFIFYHKLWAIVRYPLVLAGIADRITFQQLEPIGGFMAVMNLSIVAGIIFSSPLLIYFIMQFVLPGLKTTEKKVLFPALAVGGGLFMMGACFAYFLVAPRALTFFQDFNAGLSSGAEGAPAKPMLMAVDLAGLKNFYWMRLPHATITFEATPVVPSAPAIFWGISHYVKFICQFILIFGLCFELPVVVMALVKLDILSYKVMKGTRSWALVAIAVVAMIVAPSPDVFTLALIAVPLYCLYEVCIWIAWWMDKRDRQLYPEHYKALEEDEKLLSGEAADWDNEHYNPWGGDDDHHDFEPPPNKPAGTEPMGDQPLDAPHPDTHHAGEGGSSLTESSSSPSHDTGEGSHSETPPVKPPTDTPPDSHDSHHP